MFSGIKDRITGYFKGYFLNTVVVEYLTGFVKRLDGYKTFLGILLSGLYVAAEMISSPEINGVLAVFIKVLSGVTTGTLDPADIGLLASSLLTIWGIASKIIKKKNGVPQVPTIVIDKEPVKDGS